MGDQHDGGVERLEVALEPLERLDVEVVGRLVEQQQVGVAGQRAGERGARQLAAAERLEAAVEVLVAEAEAVQRRVDRLAPVVAAGVLEPRLRAGVGVERGAVGGARRPSRARARPAAPRGRAGPWRRRARSRAGCGRGRAAGAGRAARSGRPWRSSARRRRPSVSPASIRSSVVLPAPLRPDSVSRSRRSSRNETPRRSGSPAMSLAMSDAIRTAIDLRGYPPLGARTPLLTITLFALSAPAALGRDHDGGEGWWGETNDKVVTYAGFILIVAFPTLVLVLTLIQSRLEKRKDRVSPPPRRARRARTCAAAGSRIFTPARALATLTVRDPSSFARGPGAPRPGPLRLTVRMVRYERERRRGAGDDRPAGAAERRRRRRPRRRCWRRTSASPPTTARA